jgi:molecular chaperone DnaK (HSP70)
VQTKVAQYLVGIDLGTTHTVVAYARAEQKLPDIKLFNINQLVAPGQVAARPLLPSVRYHPAPNELSAEDLVYPSAGVSAVIGEAARVLGAKTKGRLVASAKSWLSHPSVDYHAEILPWGSDDEIAKVSPIAASASYLAHIRTVWAHQFPDAPLEKQDIVITVPASFDEGARSLTLEAAKLAGLDRVRLLEEPQAVCYDWLKRHSGQVKQALAGVNLLLVCDVGGGTTDLTLIKVEHGDLEPKLTRIGVGDHLMLGGDNIDLALAHVAESRINTEKKRLSAADFSQLLEQCRMAKERLLADDAPEQVQVTLLGGGSRLIGALRSATLGRDEVRGIALDGFFPLSGLDETPDKKRSGVLEFGLPYAAEPAISKHIAAFLKLHADAAGVALNGLGRVPDAILLNGGVFRSQPITQRVIDLLALWRQQAPVLLENKHPELSVALGAVSYAQARRDKKIQIGGGAARSYFLLVDTDQRQQQGVCLLPKGSAEGEEVVLKTRQFALRLGQPVRFHLASMSGDIACKAGDLVTINDDFHMLPPLAVAFSQVSVQAQTEVTVELAVTQTEMGTLKIQCVSVQDNKLRWDVEFQIRKNQGSKLASAGLPTDSQLPLQLPAAIEKIQLVFGAKSKQVDPKAVKNLRAELEKQLASERNLWGMPLLRALFSALWEGEKFRRRSDRHERLWLNLVGFCLRPGLGYPLDDWRVEQIWKLYPHNIQFVNDSQNWSEWWTLWRRVAGGLSATAQEQIFDDIAKYINPTSARLPAVTKQLASRSYDDIVRLAAVLEALPLAKKIQLGDWLLMRLQKTSEAQQTWWAVGRIGARQPFYGSDHNVVPVATAEAWLAQLLAVDWKSNSHASFAATQIARMSGDRARDIDDAMRVRVVEKLKLSKSPNSWVEMVMQVKELDEKEEKQFFGEALPPGLKLINSV